MSSANLPQRSSGAAPAPQELTRIQLCGAFAVCIAGRHIEHFPGRQGRVMFAYLVVKRDRAVSRDELIDVLWPSHPPVDPDAAFSSVLARLRQAVSKQVIDGRSELCLRLEANAEIDIETVAARTRSAERLLRDGDARAAWEAAESARRIAARPFMAGFEAAWVDAVRDELRDFDVRCLEVQARAGLAVESLDGMSAARALVDRNPYRESSCKLLMELHARRGDPAEAINTYDRFRQFLQAEHATAPSAEIRALYERLLRSDQVPSAPSRQRAQIPLPTPIRSIVERQFVGRGRSLERLRAALRASAGPERRLALLQGDPGVGKTRIAAEFAAEVHGADVTVLYGRCDQDPIRSYQPFVEALRHYLQHGGWVGEAALRPHLRELARLVPEAWPEPENERPAPSSEAERHLLFDAVLRLIDRAAADRVVLLVLDDLHWADKPTLLMLRHLLRHVDPAALLVVGMVRGGEMSNSDMEPFQALVGDLHRERRLDRIELEGLDEQEAEALIADRLAVPAAPGFVRGLRARTDGNPFFIEESLRSLVEARVIRSGAAATENALRSIGVPRDVVDVILRRLTRVSDRTRDALRAAAVAGREFDLGVAQEVLSESDDHVLEAMEDAIEAGLIVEVPEHVDRFTFCHALVRYAIYDGLSASRRLRLHLRVGQALEAGAGVEIPSARELAHHFYVARQLGSASKALDFGVRAGQEAAAAAAYEEAVEHYERALTVVEEQRAPDEGKRCEVLLALGRAQWQAGEACARATYLEVATSARERGANALLARAALGLGERYWEANMVDLEYRALLNEALTLCDEGDSSVRARLIARYAEYLHFSADHARAAELCAEAVAMARRLGDAPTLLKVLMAQHVVLLHPMHLPERRKVMDEVLVLADSHHGLSAEARHWRLCDLCELGEIATARTVQAELAALADALRQPMLQYVAAGWHGVLALIDGDVDGAERSASEALRLAERAHSGDATSTHLVRLFTPRRMQGRLDEMLPDIRAIAKQMRMPAWYAASALAEVEVGDVDRGRASYERLLSGGLTAVPRDWYWLPTLSLLAETCSALGDEAAAGLLYGELILYRRRYVQVSIAVWWGSLERHLGMLATVSRDYETAEEHFAAALERNRRCEASLMTAETECAYGEMLVRRAAAGDRTRAATLGREAERFAAARGLHALRRRAAGLVDQGRAESR